MVHPLIGIHAALGEIGAFAFLWVFVELLNPDSARVRRAKIAALIGVVFLFLSWIAGGYYYVTVYGSEVKPLVKAGPTPWAHLVIMETKEHVFLFLPFLSLVAYSIVRNYKEQIIREKRVRNAALLFSALVIIIALLMAGMGYLISSGARAALEASA